MPATYTPGADGINLVRLLIPDNDVSGLTPSGGVYTLTTYAFLDEELAAFLAAEYADPYRAAALALESLAGKAAAGKKIAGLGFLIDTTGGSALYLSRANALRARRGQSGVVTSTTVMGVSPVVALGTMTAGSDWTVR